MKKIIVVVFFLLFIPQIADAQWRSRDRDSDDNDWGRDSSYEDELDDDVVKTFPIPVLFGVLYSRLTPDFGAPRGGGTREHEGQDMLAPQGTPIVTPTAAVVTGTGEGPSAGLYVYTVNPGGERFRYMHLDTIADIDRGDVLEPGDLIGTVGDTGNAGAGVYHLHFETRDEDGANDPYPRMTETFTLEEKASFLDGILDKVDEDKDEYAEFLVTTFRTDMTAMLNAGYDLPDEIVEALEDRGIVSANDQAKKLAEIIRQLPTYLTMEMGQGSEGVAVKLLQLYVIYTGEGAARNALAAAGMTGYYGPVTTAAVAELQTATGITASGRYDAATRTALLD